MSSDNPYSKILNIIREEGVKDLHTSFYFGKVTKLNEVNKPYEVTTNGITLYKDDLYINPKIDVKVGSTVLLVRMNEKFIIICEVVSL